MQTGSFRNLCLGVGGNMLTRSVATILVGILFVTSNVRLGLATPAALQEDKRLSRLRTEAIRFSGGVERVRVCSWSHVQRESGRCNGCRPGEPFAFSSMYAETFGAASTGGLEGTPGLVRFRKVGVNNPQHLERVSALIGRQPHELCMRYGLLEIFSRDACLADLLHC